jgi:hypothetical protein
MDSQERPMTDRELLELAAKAAGIRINHWVYDDLDSSPAVLETGEVWNPRDDDGDALRLAVRCQIDVNHGDLTVVAERVGPIEVGVAESKKTDPYAATRRAIVRAVAEIGRQMP